MLKADDKALTMFQHYKLSIGFPYIATRFGGSTVSSLILARSLMEHGHCVRVLAHGRGPLVDEAAAQGLEVIQLPNLPAIFEDSDRLHSENILAFGACRNAINDILPDIVHTNDLAM